MTGVPAAVLAATAGVTGLTSTTGRIPAAILALAAAASSAAAGFLRSRDRHDRNAERRRGWLILEGEARLVRAYCTQADPSWLYQAMRVLVGRRKLIISGKFDLVLSADPVKESLRTPPDGPSPAHQ